MPLYFSSIEAMHESDAERAVQEALRVQLLGPAERYAWIEDQWDPLQRFATSIFSGVEPHQPHTVLCFESLQEKNRYEEAYELQRALRLQALRKDESLAYDATARRLPVSHDLLALGQALCTHCVEYALVGGIGMVLHKFARMTDDIDLLLPVDAANNARLIRALQALEGVGYLPPDCDFGWMNSGLPLTLQGDIAIDFLYATGLRTFGQLRQHIQTIEIGSVTLTALNVAGTLQTKQTSRPADFSDREKLKRLAELQHSP